MDDNLCHQCGAEIEGEGVAYRGRVFCCDDCCDEFEAAANDASEPDELALAEGLDDDLDDDLGYRDGDDDDDDDYLDDDYDIKPEDF